ncbi:larval serum protein 1 gamma chain [Lucilia sericata]|uniref:larval serum protein 1 gamma chain n=1 Tax=Lucilia sericata TaxID=13632 RepID=UPI0018A82022|nr:larval serum protein 1 gamma chain [Lucilia sericata]
MLQNTNFYNVIIWAALCITPMLGLPGGNIVNKYFLEKQKFLFEIVHQLQEPLQNDEWLNAGKTLVLDKDLYLDFNTLMEKFIMKANASTLLPRNDIFYLTDKTHLEELKGLYYFLYNAKDFETLRQNICWARLQVQPQMFVYALTQTLMKREDFKGLILPKIYEIWPQHFLSDKYIHKLKHFNYVQWSRAEMLADFNETINNNNCNIGQWWCKQNLLYKIYQEKERMILPKNIYGNFRNSSKWLQALEDVSLYWLPVDFSREVASVKELTERSNTYLIEDKAWNTYWYYTNMGLWLNERGQNDLYSKSLREWWFWNLQQLIVRYKMELTTTQSKSSLDPYLLNFQTLKYQTINNKNSLEIWNFINDLFSKTEKALYEQTFELKNATRLQLNNPQHLEYFLNDNFSIEKIMKALMSLPVNENKPTVLQYYETMLRSKEFYQYAEIIINLYKSLKSNFEPYKPQDVQSLGVSLNGVEITELKTYFEIVDTDVTNLLRTSNSYFEGKLLWFKTLLARQPSLQHQPFKLQLYLTSDKPQSVLVRTFLARDCQAAGMTCSSSTELFQLDTFVSTLAAGFNIIERESKDFYGYMLPSLTYTELYHFTQLALNEEYQFPFNITLGNCRFPHHLKLPKGLEVKGLPVKFVFVVTSYNYRFHKGFNLDCDFSSGILAFDDMPPGFPFDREISESIFMNDNILIKNMRIYHDEYLRFR